MIFNHREITERALLRAEVIITHRKRRRAQAASAAVLVCVCTAGAIGANTLFDYRRHELDKIGYVLIEEGQIPLGMPSQTGAAEGNRPAYSIPYYDKVKLTAGSTNIRMLLINPEGNSHLLTFEIILLDVPGGETLYKSEMVAPSEYIENFALSRALGEGEYEAKLVISAFEPGNFTPAGCADISLILTAS